MQLIPVKMKYEMAVPSHGPQDISVPPPNRPVFVASHSSDGEGPVQLLEW